MKLFITALGLAFGLSAFASIARANYTEAELGQIYHGNFLEDSMGEDLYSFEITEPGAYQVLVIHSTGDMGLDVYGPSGWEFYCDNNQNSPDEICVYNFTNVGRYQINVYTYSESATEYDFSLEKK